MILEVGLSEDSLHEGISDLKGEANVTLVVSAIFSIILSLVILIIF